MNTKNNQRFTETQKSIQDTLLFLLQEKKLEQIHVKDICAHADINRSTFYRHYTDVYDLMNHIEERIQGDLIKQFKSSPQPFSVYMNLEFLEILIEHVGKYRTFYLFYLQNYPDNIMETGFRIIWEQDFKTFFQSIGVTDESRMLYYFYFFKAGLITTLQHWLKGGCQESVSELAQIIWKVSPHLISTI